VSSEDPNLGEAIARFMSSRSVEDRATRQPDAQRFLRWFGSERLLSQLTAAEVEDYAEGQSRSDADAARKLVTVKDFLAYAKKVGWTAANLGVNIKVRKTKASAAKRGPYQKQPEPVAMTKQGYADLEAELGQLKSQRLVLIEDIRKAAADKDFRENTPFHAAREQRSHVEGRIIEIEETLKAVVLIDDKPAVASARIEIGSTVVLQDEASGEETRYTLVSPREIDLSKGKISGVSPLGRAVMGKTEGYIAEVSAPAGKLRYRIKRVE
jgi:transcription elongation factor GreA